MSDNNYLPDFVEPPPAEEKPIEDANADPLVSKADDSEGSVKMEIEDQFEGDEEIIREEMKEDIMEEAEPEPVVKPKRKLKNEEIFRTPQILPVAEPEKPKKQKRKASAKQLEALAKARENMKKKREEAKKLKEAGKEPPPSKRQQKQERQVKEVIDKQSQMYSAEQISNMVEAGIAKYDQQRKARKEVKKKKQQEEEQQKQVQRQVQRALGTPAVDDIWGQALAGLI
jgi:hypothetical protein